MQLQLSNAVKYQTFLSRTPVNLCTNLIKFVSEYNNTKNQRKIGYLNFFNKY